MTLSPGTMVRVSTSLGFSLAVAGFDCVPDHGTPFVSGFDTDTNDAYPGDLGIVIRSSFDQPGFHFGPFVGVIFVSGTMVTWFLASTAGLVSDQRTAAVYDCAPQDVLGPYHGPFRSPFRSVDVDPGAGPFLVVATNIYTSYVYVLPMCGWVNARWFTRVKGDGDDDETR